MVMLKPEGVSTATKSLLLRYRESRVTHVPDMSHTAA